MEIQEIIKAFSSGGNLVNVLGHVCLLQWIDNSIPVSFLQVANLDTGRGCLFHPSHLLSFLGHVEENRLPFRVCGCRVAPREKVLSAPLILLDGHEVQPGDFMQFESGIMVTYLEVGSKVETCSIR